jgi:hypothetical protein
MCIGFAVSQAVFAAICGVALLGHGQALSSQLPAANVLAALLDKLRSASAHGRRGRLAVVRAMAPADH